MQNDKNIIVFDDKNSGSPAGADNDDFIIPTMYKKSDETLIHAEHSEGASFLAAHNGEPFLGALRALYREVCRIEQDEIKPDVRTVKRKMIQIMDMHMRSLAEQGYDNTQIMIVRYIISTFLDELLGRVEWPGGEAWANQSLLGHYYRETYGGEKFFKLLERFAREPGKYIQHMRLVYACLSLGYRGKFSLVPNSDLQIEGIRQELFSRIKSFTAHTERFYSDHPASNIKHKLTTDIPYKLFLAGGFLVMAIVYAVFTNMVVQNENSLIETLSSETAFRHAKDTNGSI